MGSHLSERAKEIRRRRQRKQKLLKLKARLTKASGGEVELIKAKIRKLTPGANDIFSNWEI